MRLKKNVVSIITLIILLSNLTSINASTEQISSEQLNETITNAVSGTNFNGTVEISRVTTDGYDVLFKDAVGINGGYDADTLYDIGSVSKLYTTVAIMQLQEAGKLDYDDKITLYFDSVPADKQDVKIKNLLTHTSGIYAEENDDHNVSKEDELTRILNSPQQFVPGDNYLYSNAGYTLLAAIIEEASGFSYELYLTKYIFEPLNLENTGFPSTEELKKHEAVSGILNGEEYGLVTNFDFGWYSKGYTDILTTVEDLTYFLQALINGSVINEENLSLMSKAEVDLENQLYRGYGTEIMHNNSAKKIIGHSGVWYGGNTIAYYRPSDKILFVAACDQLDVNTDLPAYNLFETLNNKYQSGSFAELNPIEEIKVDYNPTKETKNNADVMTYSAQTVQGTTTEPTQNKQEMNKAQIKRILIIILCLISIAIIVNLLIIRKNNSK